MYTVGKLAKRFGLSRSTLLYYDSIGLLRPTARSASEYRYYSEAGAQRLAKIVYYRQAGLSLTEIKRVLDSPANNDELTTVLEGRLSELNAEIYTLRQQQQFIVALLRNRPSVESVGVMNKETWVSLLQASGFDDEDLRQWHIAFEQHAPRKHEAFLQFLGLLPEEISAIRVASKIGPGLQDE